MTKKILAALLVIAMIACLLPTTVLAASTSARFVFADGEKTANLEVIINQGDPAVFLKTVGKFATKEGASENDYNIKITYNAGENPTVYFKGAEIHTYGDGDGCPAITIGSPAADSEYNDQSVDIVIERNTTLAHQKVWGCSFIKSYITGTLTFNRKAGTLAIHSMQSPGADAVIDVVGDILFKGLNMTMQGAWSGLDRANYIRSANGNITIDGGKITITTNGSSGVSEANQPTARNVFLTEASGKNITIMNEATVKVTIRNAIKGFNTKGDLIIKDSSVVVKAQENEKATIFGDAAPVIEGYAGGYTALGDEAAYNEDNFDTYKVFSIVPAGTEDEGGSNDGANNGGADSNDGANNGGVDSNDGANNGGSNNGGTETTPSTEATTPSTEATTPSTEATTPSTEATTPSTEATTPATEATAPSNKDTQPKNNTNTIILIVALVVIVGAGAAAAVIILKNKAADDDEEEAEETTEE